MYTFCFDEYGEFEKRNQSIIFIGGFMYNDQGDEKETENEKARIISFLKTVCEEAGTKFPRDLHSDIDDNNKEEAKATKDVYLNKFSEFIKSGTYDNFGLTDNERKGKYIFLIEYAKGYKYGIKSNAWIADDKATNKYDNMVSDFIQNAIFYNPGIENQNEIILDFPTRVVKTDANTEDFLKKGLKRNQDNTNRFYDTGNDFFRSATSEIIKKHHGSDFKIQNLEARSISLAYSFDDNFNEVELKEYAFLLLADVFCTYITYLLNNKNIKIDKVEDTFKLNMNSQCLIYCYEELEEIFRNAYDAVREKNCLEAIKNVSLIKIEEKSHYCINWASFLLDELNKVATKQDIINSLKKFDGNFDAFTNKEKEDIIEWFSQKKDELGEEIVSLSNIITRNENNENSFKKISEYIETEKFFDAYKELAYVENAYRNINNSIIDESIKILEEKIKEYIDNESFIKLVNDMNDNTFKTIVPPEIDYIFEKTNGLYEIIKDKTEIDDYTKFLLYDTGVVLCNHSANTKQGRIYLSKIKKLKKYIEESEYDKRRNRYIVAYIDLLNFDDAFRLSRDTVINSGKKSRERKLAIGDFNYKSKDHAKALSQFAQICAFMNNANSYLVEKGYLSDVKFEGYKDLVEGLFEMSLKKFKEGSADYYITINYLMHYYLTKIDELTYIKEYEDFEVIINKKSLSKSEKRKLEKKRETYSKEKYSEQIILRDNLKKKYKKYAEIYFNENNTPLEQLKYILSLDRKSKINNTYALFLWSKSLLKIYESVDVKDVFSESALVDDIKKMYKERHPCELISLYLAEAAHVLGDGTHEKQFMNNIDINSNEELIKCLVSNAKYNYYLFIKKEGDADKEKEVLSKLLKTYTKGRLPKGEVKDVITYTYS